MDFYFIRLQIRAGYYHPSLSEKAMIVVAPGRLAAGAIAKEYAKRRGWKIEGELTITLDTPCAGIVWHSS